MSKTLGVSLIVFLVVFDIMLIFPGSAAYLIPAVSPFFVFVVWHEFFRTMPILGKLWRGKISLKTMHRDSGPLDVAFYIVFVVTALIAGIKIGF
jgi:hypothetical protein